MLRLAKLSYAFVLSACLSIFNVSAEAGSVGDTDITLLYQYADRFLESGDFSRAMAVYGMIIGAYSGARDTEKVRETCDAMYDALPDNSVVESNLLYWICPDPKSKDEFGEKKFRKLEATLLTFVHQPYPTDPEHSGSVELQFDVSADGKAKNITVIGSTDPVFEETAIDLLKSAYFRRGIENGSPVDTIGKTIVVRFQTEDDS